MNRLAILPALALLATAANAQNSLVFTGRFPFVSLDQPNERPGGTITALEEFDLSLVTPGSGAFARSWLPAITHQCFRGDPAAVGDYTSFNGIKSGYFERWNFAGVFFKHADKVKGDPRLAFLTVRDNGVGKNFQVFTSTGSATTTIQPGDFFRWKSNGNVEFFITQALIAKAQGPQTGSFADGASAICQDAAGNLYYSPAEGGHWINGNNLLQGPIFAFDGSICMIQSKDITYDAAGNVQDVVASSAVLLFIETNGLSPTVREMGGNANPMDNTGVPLGSPVVTANVTGLEIDPNGGTLPAAYTIGDPSQGGTAPVVPNFLWCVDNGTWGGTIFSTAPAVAGGLPGSLAVINGVKCGSDVNGVPANGSWLGVQLDAGNFQPTLMGLAAITAVPAPMVADIPGSGRLLQTDPTLFIDFNGPANATVFLVLAIGPAAPGLFPASFDLGTLLGPTSFNTLFTIGTSISGLVGQSDANGYLAFSVPNPNTTGSGATLLGHGVALFGTGFQVSNPFIIQYR